LRCSIDVQLRGALGNVARIFAFFRNDCKALQAAVMAFASQWSHSPHNAFWRSKEGMSRMKAAQSQSISLFSEMGRTNNPSLSTECERLIQITLWHEARSAIQASTEIDSLIVSLAYMIFALTQRPVEAKDKSTPEAQTWPTGNSVGSRRGAEESSVYDSPGHGTDPAMEAIVNEEWNPFYTSDLEALTPPPVYLEAAVRNFFSWRRKIERYRRLRSKSIPTAAMAPWVLWPSKTIRPSTSCFGLGSCVIRHHQPSASGRW
jgi:hypothetical protein